MLLKTTKGNILLELFEKEAPNTVANFIFLVEKKFYEDSPFHSVIPGFVAQTGSSAKTGEPDPGYRIACECEKPGARKHFRGSVSMALSGKDTGGSQFFICLTPTNELDGVNTVFGRVIQGWDALSELTPMDPGNPDPMAEMDKIISAEVVRKTEGVKYRPKVIREKDITSKKTASKDEKTSQNNEKNESSAY
ncbi:MAG: peptidylprolyl isomerase [Planctomycetia bacterium]|nr:peptidylprolyl isomerase [Planctomycetia bacterium]